MDALKRVVYFHPVIKSYHNIAYLSISVVVSLLVFSFFMSLDGGKTARSPFSSFSFLRFYFFSFKWPPYFWYVFIHVAF